MNYYFDNNGWLSDAEIHDRSTDIIPPEHGIKVVGQPYPNWTGEAWAMVPYAKSVQANNRRPEIISRLAEIDRLGDSPRARREALLGNTTWLASLDSEAATLRAELAGL